MDKIINLGIPHVGELIFESIDTPELIKCLNVSETWRELAGNVLIKRSKGNMYIKIFDACKSGNTKVAQHLMVNLNEDELFQSALVSNTWKFLAENVLIKRWKGKIFSKMCEACKSGETKVVQLLLERCYFEETGLNIEDEMGMTALMWACYKGHKEVVQLLLDHFDQHIELDARNDDGMSPLMWACHEGHKDVVKLLLDHSKRIELNSRNKFGKTAFTLACKNGHKSVVKLLLDHTEKNIDLNARCISGMTALMYACSHGQKDVVELLLDNCERIDLDARDNDNWTAFMWARRQEDAIQLLLKHSDIIDTNIY